MILNKEITIIRKHKRTQQFNLLIHKKSQNVIC
jgi:hypothetical protein